MISLERYVTVRSATEKNSSCITILYPHCHDRRRYNRICDDSGTDTTLAIKVPVSRSSRVTNALCSQVDLPELSYRQSAFLLPVLVRQEERALCMVFAEITYHTAYEPMCMIRARQYLLLRRYDSKMNRPALLQHCIQLQKY